MDKNSIKMASFNINKNFSVKCNDEILVELVNKVDIMCIQETWLTANQSIQIAGYEYFRSDRRKTKYSKTKGNTGGGVVILYKQEIKPGITKITTNNTESLWVKLDKYFFGLHKDIYLACCYIPPSDSFIHKNYDMFDILNNEIIQFSHKGNIVILGDLNSRIGNLTECYVQDFTGTKQQSTLNPHIRSSMDTKTKTQGRKLMNVINDNHLSILNGRAIGDLDGKYIIMYKI